MKKAAKATGKFLFWFGASLVLAYAYFLHDAKSAYDREIALAMALEIPLTPKQLAESETLPVDARNAVTEILAIRKAIDGLPRGQIKAALDHFEPLTKESLDKPDLDAAASAIDQMAPILTLASRASRKTYLFYGSEGTFKHTLLIPEMGGVKSAAKLFTLKFLVENRRGQRVEAIESARDAFRLGAMLYLDKDFISYMVGLAVQTNALRAIATEAHRDPNRSDLIDLLEELSKELPIVDLQAIKLGETSVMLDLFRLGKSEDPTKELLGFSFGKPELSFEDRIHNIASLQWYAKAHSIRNCRVAWQYSDQSPREYARSLAEVPQPNWMTRVSLRVLRIEDMEAINPLDIRPIFESARIWNRILARTLREKSGDKFPVQIKEPLSEEIPEYLKTSYWSDGTTIRVTIENEIDPDKSKTFWFPKQVEKTLEGKSWRKSLGFTD